MEGVGGHLSKKKCKPKKGKKGRMVYDFADPEAVGISDMYSMGMAALIEAQNIASQRKDSAGLVSVGTAWAAVAAHISQLSSDEDSELPFGFKEA
jgi:hypothetical protein